MIRMRIQVPIPLMNWL